MNINNSIGQYNNFNNVQMNSSTQSLTGNTANQLEEGQVFEGSINSIDSNGRVVIGLANGQTMSARLDAGVSLNQGQSLFFQVKSNDGAMIQIRPVSMDITGNTTLLNALDSAGIVPNKQSLEMVDQMMKQSMPINSEALLSMNRSVLANPDIDLQTVVMLKKYNIPVNKAMAAMFENYQSNEASLQNDIGKITNSIPKLLSELPAKNVVEFQNTLNSIISVTDEQIDAISGQSPDGTSQATAIFAGDETGSTLLENEVADEQNLASIKPENSSNVQILAEEVAVKGNDGQPANPINQTYNVDGNLQKTVSFSNELVIAENENTIQQANADSVENNLINNNSVESQENLVDINTVLDKNVTKLIKGFEDFPDLKNYLTDSVSKFSADNNNFSGKNLFDALTKYLNNNLNDSQLVKNIVGSKGYSALLKSVFSEEFSMKPEEFTYNKALNSFYKKISYQSGALAKALEMFDGKNAEEIKVAANSLKDNVSFMNTSNDMYTYLQVPFKMFNQNTDGTLYVRQNKKNAYQQGDTITAFLHFDMKYLGSTDIFVSLQNKNVSCKWTLSDEKALELIENNIDILNERLNQKGYNLTTNCEVSDKTVDFVNDFLQGSVEFESKEENLLHRYSFDMRA